MSRFVSARSEELRDLRQALQSEKRLWGWGTDDGLIPWEDRHGNTMLVFWKSEARAIEENGEDDSEPSEKALPYSVATLLDRLGPWEDAGVSVIGLEARDGKILYSLTPAEFEAFLQGGSRGPALP
jgi:hypothetical protein